MEEKLRSFGALITKLLQGKNLTRNESFHAYKEIILNEQPELQQGAFLAAHFAKGPTLEELAGAWEAIDAYDTAKLDANGLGIVCDIVGTGADMHKTINCSSPAALVLSACGVTVAKKGARKVTGVSGATCIFENLGIPINKDMPFYESMLKQHRFCYIPGEVFLKSGWARLIQHKRFPSAFHIVGPLTRPCPQTQVSIIGGYSPEICQKMIDILAELSMPFAACPFGTIQEYSEGGIDEVSPCGPTVMFILDNKAKTQITLTPKDFGIPTYPFTAIASRATAKENAQIIYETLCGHGPSAVEDFIAINASVALVATKKASSWQEGTLMAKNAIRTGAVAQKLHALQTFCHTQHNY